MVVRITAFTIPKDFNLSRNFEERLDRGFGEEGVETGPFKEPSNTQYPPTTSSFGTFGTFGTSLGEEELDLTHNWVIITSSHNLCPQEAKSGDTAKRTIPSVLTPQTLPSGLVNLLSFRRNQSVQQLSLSSVVQQLSNCHTSNNNNTNNTNTNTNNTPRVWPHSSTRNELDTFAAGLLEYIADLKAVDPFVRKILLSRNAPQNTLKNTNERLNGAAMDVFAHLPPPLAIFDSQKTISPITKPLLPLLPPLLGELGLLEGVRSGLEGPLGAPMGPQSNSDGCNMAQLGHHGGYLGHHGGYVNINDPPAPSTLPLTASMGLIAPSSLRPIHSQSNPVGINSLGMSLGGGGLMTQPSMSSMPLSSMSMPDYGYAQVMAGSDFGLAGSMWFNRTHNDISGIRQPRKSADDASNKKGPAVGDRPLTPPAQGWYAKYSSGVTGVVWDRVHQAWVVSWTLGGKRTFRHFTCKSYGGFDKAREAAIEFRLARNREIAAYNKKSKVK